MLGLFLANVDALGFLGSVLEEDFVGKVVEQNHVSRFEYPESLEREKFGIARPRADEVNLAAHRFGRPASDPIDSVQDQFGAVGQQMRGHFDTQPLSFGWAAMHVMRDHLHTIG